METRCNEGSSIVEWTMRECGDTLQGLLLERWVTNAPETRVDSRGLTSSPQFPEYAFGVEG